MVTLVATEPKQEELLSLYAVPSGPSVRVNFVTTLDGHATGPDGRSGSINSPADGRTFEVLRAHADAVLVGAGTARKEGYGRLRTEDTDLLAARDRMGRAPHPTLVVVTASGKLPEGLLDPSAPGGTVLVLCADRTPRSNLVDRLGADAVVVCGQDAVQPHDAVAALRERGLERLLCEGGPHVFGDWLRAGVVDELCLTLRPTLTGGTGPRIVESAALDPMLGAELLHVLHADGDLMLRYRMGGAHLTR